MANFARRDAKHGKSTNPYIDRRESKNKEIKQALVHRARLRKQYFKDLKEEGEAIPTKEEKKDRQARAAEEKFRPDFKERAEIAKKRKALARQEREMKRQEYIKNAEKKKAERERKKESLSQKTRTGQPLMGPRIANLLEKIQKDN